MKEKKVAITISSFEEVMEKLILLDSDKADYKITITEFNQFKNDKELLKTLCGCDKDLEWAEFKIEFIAHQKYFGIIWERIQGFGGPLGLEKVELPGVIGAELAEKLLKQNTQEGNLIAILKNLIPSLYQYIKEDEVSQKIDIKSIRDEFKSISKDKYGFRFTPGRNSNSFRKTINEYTFKGKETRKTEHEFGEYIIEEVKQCLGLTFLIHSQTGRKAGKYQNVDFEGFKVSREIMGDEFLMYNFEIKPSNKISSISEAISQAINYKHEAHYTYIIIPNFTQESFYNDERFQGFKDLCRNNDIGIISIELDPEREYYFDDENRYIQAIEILKARRTELEDIDKLENMIRDSQWEQCPLCNRIVHKERREKCPWKVNTNSGEYKCMKVLMEEKFAKS